MTETFKTLIIVGEFDQKIKLPQRIGMSPKIRDIYIKQIGAVKMKTFHIEAEEGQIAKTVLMPGDPMRANTLQNTI